MLLLGLYSSFIIISAVADVACLQHSKILFSKKMTVILAAEPTNMPMSVFFFLPAIMFLYGIYLRFKRDLPLLLFCVLVIIGGFQNM